LANPSFFPWISPIVASLLLSAPLSVFTSRASLGKAFRNAGLLLIPEEVELPAELADLEENLRRPEPYTPFPLSRKQGFVRAVVDPLVHALHTSLLLRYKKKAPARENALEELVEKAAVKGPGSLTRREKMELLKDPRHLGELHRRVWEAESRDGAAQWGLVLPPSESGE
jgi:membrane glycosyltransferase